jgi:molybdopterin-containing oxidoreductase family membrane subunit
MTAGLTGRVLSPGPRSTTALIVLGLLVVLGVVGIALKVAGGFADRAAWGYPAAVFSFLLSSAMAAPIVAWATRGAKGHWARPLRRSSELTAVSGLALVLLIVPIILAIPPIHQASGPARYSIWFDWPLFAPGGYDFFAVLGLAFLGLGILYVSALPDLGALRDAAPGRGLFRVLARGWRGTPRQWYSITHGIAVLGALYFAFFVFAQYLLSIDLSESLVPGWFSAIFPLYSVVTGLEGAVAMTLVVAGLLRWLGGYDQYLGLSQFWSLAKIQLALGLFWFYHFYSEFIVLWYGRIPREQMVAQLLDFGPYLLCFLITVLGLFLVPFLALIWNRVRVSIKGPFLVSVAVLIGLFFDRVRLYVSAWSVQNFYSRELEAIPATRLPDLADLLVVVGGLAVVPFLVLLALRVVPAVSLWEVKEGRLLQVERPYLLGHARIIGKPR